MIKFNADSLKDKIYACWIGKNIGGTMGTPFEGKREINNISGFTSPEGKALPNDDLDLQLIWLKAMEERGPLGINAQVLGEYWLNYIPPHWNEYGIGKANMRAGLLPPASGEYKNNWKHSNGAWIRSEIWACLAPGCPDTAIAYAFEDACVDHGLGEGTYAELFTAAMQSAAFVEKDPKTLLNIGLSKIPSNCRTARSVKMAMAAYEHGADWKKVRNELVEDSADLGWFQAPANVGFVVIGLLWGGGDFKKSLITAINCGDDTDCTGATLGALLGIMNGTAGIPEDWRGYIGDDIITIAVDRGSWWGVPKTCAELTERVARLVPMVLQVNNLRAAVHAEADDFSAVKAEQLMDKKVAKRLHATPPYSSRTDFIYATAVTEFLGEPVIVPHGELHVRVTFRNTMPDPKHLHLRWLLPEGWSVRPSAHSVYLAHCGTMDMLSQNVLEAVIVASDKVEPINRLVLEAVCPGRPTVGLIPITVLG